MSLVSVLLETGGPGPAPKPPALSSTNIVTAGRRSRKPKHRTIPKCGDRRPTYYAGHAAETPLVGPNSMCLLSGCRLIPNGYWACSC